MVSLAIRTAQQKLLPQCFGSPSIILSPVGRSSITAKVTRQTVYVIDIDQSDRGLPHRSNERSHTLTPFKNKLNLLSTI